MINIQYNKDKMIKITFLFLVMFILSFVIIQSLIFLTLEDHSNIETDYLIIHGAAVWDDNPSPTLENRLIKGIEYLNKHPEAKVIVTGGLGEEEEYTEAKVMKDYLTSNEIAKNRIIKEENSRNTFENLLYTKDILKEKEENLENITLMLTTSEFHMLRAQMLANRQGFKTLQNPAKTPREVFLQYTIREYFALIKSFILDK
ncbi:YdcF family protein [Natranaerobius trueperi]|uniref:DUF218 domain-containing protein n=1 Tax=Natranaerobius trueperi TaxID=759412 RepID=A0A226BUV0_9FIRM|nr:YdcF family protein [Natranaerobius trueperi]OWZ82763.1 hypothetical protein CDO51_12330 [Natranaerobius trueperi]